MTETAESQYLQSRLENLNRALDAGAAGQIRQLLVSLHPAEIADLLESFPHGPREILWELVDPDDHGETLLHVNDEVRAGLIREMETDDLVAATEGLESDDLADLLRDLPDAVIHEVLRSMDKQDRDRLEAVLPYPEDSAGGLMSVDTITVRADVTLDVVIRYLRMHAELPDTTDK
ncbi:MAG: magnesium transporter, partial [Gammaproteobacteria bacterium]